MLLNQQFGYNLYLSNGAARGFSTTSQNSNNTKVFLYINEEIVIGCDYD